MGNFWGNTYLKKTEVEATISKINEKMRQSEINELIGAKIKFILNDSNSKNRIIKAEINMNTELTKGNQKIFYLTLEQFYQYYNSLIDCMDALDNKECEKSYLSIEKNWKILIHWIQIYVLYVMKRNLIYLCHVNIFFAKIVLKIG